MLGKVKVLLSVIISYIITSDDSVEVDNISASRPLLDMNDSVTQENGSSPNTSAILHPIPEHEAVNQEDAVDGLEGIDGLLDNNLIDNILREPNVMGNLNVDLEVGVHENQYANVDVEMDSPPNEVPNVDQSERRPKRNCRYLKHQKK